MASISVEYQDERLDFEVSDEALVGSWRGPQGLRPTEALSALRDGLENPHDFPALRQAVVPGDRVVLAWDPTITAPGPVLETLAQLFKEAGVEDGDLTVLTPTQGLAVLDPVKPQGVVLVAHDPGDRTQLAYLAATKQGRRVYLNRLLTDADLVVPVGRIGFDPLMGYRGPWSALFPSLSDHETMRAQRESTRKDHDAEAPDLANPWLVESLEVSWLLGTQFHLGLVPGSSGLFEVVAGLETAVRDHGIASLEEHWRFVADSRAETVVIGVGRPGIAATLDDLAEGLATASRLVQHGGKIVVLSRATGELGPAFQRLNDANGPRGLEAALRGHEGDNDFVAARAFARALTRADVFMLSGLPQRTVEDLSIVALERPEQARRIVSQSGSCLFINQADLTRAVVGPDEEDA
jgi:lactate racemase